MTVRQADGRKEERRGRGRRRRKGDAMNEKKMEGERARDKRRK